MLRQTLFVLTTILLTACAPSSDAGVLADVSVINRTTGETLPVYWHRGRHYVEGRAGDRYAVQLRNSTGGRILTVLSVDGVNAITGETAASSQSGYVLSPWSSAEIAGWRKDMSEVAAFYFTSLGDSYASRTGRRDNVGVIGVAVFREAVEPPRPSPEAQNPDWARADAAGRNGASDTPSPPAFPAELASRSRSLADERIGTGHGERIQAPTQTTEFRRARRSPSEVIRIYYDSRANLLARGVIPHHPRLPDPFPEGGFVPDPS